MSNNDVTVHVVADIRMRQAEPFCWVICTCGSRFEEPSPEGIADLFRAHRRAAELPGHPRPFAVSEAIIRPREPPGTDPMTRHPPDIHGDDLLSTGPGQ